MQKPENMTNGSDIADKVAVSVEVMKSLDLVSVENVDEFSQRLTSDYLKLSEVSPNGDLYCLGPQERLKLFTIGAVTRVMGDRFVYRKGRNGIWDEDTELCSSAQMRGKVRDSLYLGTYTDDMLCNSRVITSIDGSDDINLLHFTNRRFTDSSNNVLSQFDILSKRRFIFDSCHEGYHLYSIDEADFVVIAMQRALEGRTLPVSFGKMRLLGRGPVKRLFGQGAVTACSTGGKVVTLSYDWGLAEANRGIGLTAGINGKISEVNPSVLEYYKRA